MECDAYAARVTLQLIAVKVIVQRDEPDAEQGENALHEVAYLNTVASEACEVLHNNAVNFSFPHCVKQALYSGALKVDPAVPVIYKLDYLHIFDSFHLIDIPVEDSLLVFNAHAVHLGILDGQADVKSDHIGDCLIHLPKPPGADRSPAQRQS